MKGLEPSTFAMARRRSSQLSYIRRVSQHSAAGHGTITSSGGCRRSYGGSPNARHRRHPRPASESIAPCSQTAISKSARPITGEVLAHLHRTNAAGTDAAIARAAEAFETWRDVPAPRRGELIRLLGEELRREKEALGELVTLETGKISQEGLGEVQEMIDICDLAVGLSRQLFGRTIASERPGHRMLETWHPLGPIGVVTAFNFPVAVWSWNSALALVCGDPVVWKPSERTPLTAVACQALFRRAAAAFGDAPGRAARGRDRRRGPRAPARRGSPPAARVGDGLDGHGQGRLATHRRAARPRAARARRQQRHGRRARAPTSTWRCARSSSAPSAPPASAARACAG